MDLIKENIIPLGSPPSESAQRRLDLNELLAPHSVSTYFLRMKGGALTQQGIHEGDILIVDRSLPPLEGTLLVFIYEGEFLVRNFRKQNGHISLLASSPGYSPIHIANEADLLYWGAVTFSVHPQRKVP